MSTASSITIQQPPYTISLTHAQDQCQITVLTKQDATITQYSTTLPPPQSSLCLDHLCNWQQLTTFMRDTRNYWIDPHGQFIGFRWDCVFYGGESKAIFKVGLKQEELVGKEKLKAQVFLLKLQVRELELNNYQQTSLSQQKLPENPIKDDPLCKITEDNNKNDWNPIQDQPNHKSSNKNKQNEQQIEKDNNSIINTNQKQQSINQCFSPHLDKVSCLEELSCVGGIGVEKQDYDEERKQSIVGARFNNEKCEDRCMDQEHKDLSNSQQLSSSTNPKKKPIKKQRKSRKTQKNLNVENISKTKSPQKQSNNLRNDEETPQTFHQNNNASIKPKCQDIPQSSPLAQQRPHSQIGIEGKAGQIQGKATDGSQIQVQKMGSKYKLIYPNGDYYIGRLNNSQFEGHGILYSSQQGQYVGQFKNSQFHGKGQLKLIDGTLFKGNFKQGCYHGKGTQTFPSGEFYQGGFQEGLRSGSGRLEYPNGDVYKGGWNKGVKSGLGQETYGNGHKYAGSWLNGVKNGSGTLQIKNLILKQFWQKGSLISQE